MLINHEEIAALIAEMNQEVEFCVRGITQQADPEYGIQAQQGFTCRSLQGYCYVIPDRYAEIAVAQGMRSEGGYIAYVSPLGLKREEIDEKSVIKFQETYYQLVYVNGITHDATLMLHQLRLQKAQFQDDLSEQKQILGPL